MKSSSGFTLIELVVVMIIISILMAVAVPKFIDLSDSAKESHDKELIANLRTETVLMFATNALAGVTNTVGTYWPTAAEVWSGMSGTGDSTSWLYWTTSPAGYDMTNGVWSEGS